MGGRNKENIKCQNPEAFPVNNSDSWDKVLQQWVLITNLLKGKTKKGSTPTALKKCIWGTSGYLIALNSAPHSFLALSGKLVECIMQTDLSPWLPVWEGRKTLSPVCGHAPVLTKENSNLVRSAAPHRHLLKDSLEWGFGIWRLVPSWLPHTLPWQFLQPLGSKRISQSFSSLLSC